MNKEILLLFNACHNGNVAYILNNLDFELVNCTDENNRTLLHIACINNDHEMARTILKYLPNVNIEDKNNFLPITYLIKNNNLNLIKQIFEEYNGAFSREQLVKNMSIACMYDSIEIFKYFHQLLGFDLNTQDHNGNTYLMICAKYNSIKVYNYLIKNSANISLLNNDSNNVLIFSASSNAFTIFENAMQSIDINFQNRLGVNSLMVSTLYEHYNLIDLIIANNINTKLKDIDGNTALHYSVLNADKKATLQIIKADDSLINEKNNDGNTPFMLAVMQNNIELVELIMNFNVDLYLENNSDQNAFEISWSNGNMVIAKLILSKFDHSRLRELKIGLNDSENIEKLIQDKINEVREDVELNFTSVSLFQISDQPKPNITISEQIKSEQLTQSLDEDQEKHISLIDEDYEEHLVSEYNESESEVPNKYIEYEDDAIWEIASIDEQLINKNQTKESEQQIQENLKVSTNNINLLKQQINLEENENFRLMILENLKKIDSNFIEKESETLTNTQFSEEETEQSSSIIDNEKVEVQTTEEVAETTMQSNQEVFIEQPQTLEETKINKEKEKESIMNGKEFNNRYNIKWLINEEEYNQIINGEKESIFMEGQIKTTPVIYLSKIGKTKSLFEFLKSEPQRVHDRTSNNKTGLMYAAQYNNINCAKLLILVGINVNAADDHGTTALMYATFMGNVEIVKILMENNVDASMRDINGITALDIAIKNNDKELIDLLVAYQNKFIINAKTTKIDLSKPEFI